MSVGGDRLYVADTNNHAIRFIDLAGGNRTSTLEIAGLTVPTPKSPPAKPTFSRRKPGGLETGQGPATDAKIRCTCRSISRQATRSTTWLRSATSSKK